MNSKFKLTCALTALFALAACGGGGGAAPTSAPAAQGPTGTVPLVTNTTPSATETVAIQDDQLIKSIQAAAIGFVEPTGTKTAVVDGRARVIGAGSVVVRWQYALTPALADAFLGLVSSLNVPVLGVRGGGYELQLGTTGVLDEVALLQKFKDHPAIQFAYLLEQSVGTGTATTAYLSKWRDTTKSESALALFNEKKGAKANAKLGIVDAEFDAGGHGQTVLRLAVGNLPSSATSVNRIQGMWPTGFDSVKFYDVGMGWRKAISFSSLDLNFSNDFGLLESAVDDANSVINISRGNPLVKFCFLGSMACLPAAKNSHLSGEQDFREQMMTSVIKCKTKDCLIVKGAGNDGIKDDNNVFSKPNPLNSLLWGDHVINVGATNLATDKDASFSRMGKVVDLLAPGDHITYDVDAGNTSESKSGTSYAAPLVAGVAGMMRTLSPQLRSGEIKRILIDSGTVTTTDDVAAMAADRRFSIPWLVKAAGPTKQLNAKQALESALAMSSIPLSPLASQTLAIDNEVVVPVTVTRAAVNQVVDVVFLFDVSASTGAAIASFQAASKSLLANIQSQHPAAAFGVASFSDFPSARFPGDSPFRVVGGISTSATNVNAAIAKLSTFNENGGDDKESQLDAISQLSTGAGLDVDGDGKFDSFLDIKPQSIGWRTGAKRIVVMFTDVGWHDKGFEPTYAGVSYNTAALNAKAAGITLHVMLASNTSAADTAAYTSLAKELQGQVFSQSSSAATSIATLISGAVKDTFNQPATIELTGVTGVSQILSVSSKVTGVLPGKSASFNVSLKGILPADGMRSQSSAPILLWASERADSAPDNAVSTIIGRYEIPVAIPSNRSTFTGSSSLRIKELWKKFAGN